MQTTVRLIFGFQLLVVFGSCHVPVLTNPWLADNDGDGLLGLYDCDDSDPAIGKCAMGDRCSYTEQCRGQGECVEGVCECTLENYTGAFCDTCSKGWTGENCDVCPQNFTGPSCDTCSNGWSGESCDVCPQNFTGPSCDTCAGQWSGDACDVCPPNYTGVFCDICANGWTGTTCDTCAGEWSGAACDECPANYTGASCDTCANGWSGDNCDICPVNYTGDFCDTCASNYTGATCDTCTNGWKGEFCDECPPNYTGPNCDVCAGAWTGDACDDCPEGYAGPTCALCSDSHTDGVGCFKRFDIKGFYYAVGQTLTVKQGKQAIALLNSNEVSVIDDGTAIPSSATITNAYLYWSGSREEPDTAVELKGPGFGFQFVTADKCYVDDDNRGGSLSKNFYTCRADITATIAATNSAYGYWSVRGADALILPDGTPCSTTKECYEAASLASGKTYTSCIVDGVEICHCQQDGQCRFGQATIGHASFALVFIYEDGDKTRTVLMYDGMKAFINQTQTFDIQNVKTPPNLNNSGRLTYYVVEGDDDNRTPGLGQPADLPIATPENPGEKVTLRWGDDKALGEEQELFSLENPLWDDPFNGTTGAGVDIESYDLEVPANRTRAELAVSTPNLESINVYLDEVCTDPELNNFCAVYHTCDCLEADAATNTCVEYGCVDQHANDGIGLAFVILGFDSLTP